MIIYKVIMEEHRKFTEWVVVRNLRPLRLHLLTNEQQRDVTPTEILLVKCTKKRKKAQQQITILLISLKKN
jgi:hypothetical protein